MAAVTKVFIEVARSVKLALVVSAATVFKKLLLVLTWLAKVWSFWIKLAMDWPVVTLNVLVVLAMYCWDWVAIDGPANAAMAAGCTEAKPVFAVANLVSVEALTLVTAVVSMLVTKLSVTEDPATVLPVINFVAGAFLISLAKAVAAVA